MLKPLYYKALSPFIKTVSSAIKATYKYGVQNNIQYYKLNHCNKAFHSHQEIKFLIQFDLITQKEHKPIINLLFNIIVRSEQSNVIY